MASAGMVEAVVAELMLEGVEEGVEETELDHN
jgi:hypothetical protein